MHGKKHKFCLLFFLYIDIPATTTFKSVSYRFLGPWGTNVTVDNHEHILAITILATLNTAAHIEGSVEYISSRDFNCIAIPVLASGKGFHDTSVIQGAVVLVGLLADTKFDVICYYLKAQ